MVGPQTSAAGYLISHEINNSFVLINRLLKAGAEVYWVKKQQTADGQALGTGSIWVPASAAAKSVLDAGAKQEGVTVHAVAKAPTGDALKLKPIRIGLYDQYGGIMPSGWTRWMFEQYEFPFEVVYPKTLDAGDLQSQVRRAGVHRRRVSRSGRRRPRRRWRWWRARWRSGIDSRRVSRNAWAASAIETTMPQLKKFVESGGSIVTIGSSTAIGESLGLPMKNYLTEKGADGRDRQLPREKFYIPGSLLKANIDNTNPLAYGMPSQVDVFYDNSPVFRMEPDAGQRKTSSVAWFSGPEVLDSGWAWGQQYLDGGTAIAEATMGEGKVVMLGPEVAFRAQPHATFKLLFNGLYYGSAKEAPLK